MHEIDGGRRSCLAQIRRMNSSARAPLVLAVVIATGFVARFMREAQATAPATTEAVAALDSQRTRVRTAASATAPSRTRRPSAPRGATGSTSRPGTPRASKRTTRGARERQSPPSASRPRVERTPFGALPLEALAQRARDSARRATTGASAATGAPGAPVDLETASAAEIERLPGIGPALARRIVEDREQLGPFGSMSALQRVRGIGPALARRLRGRVTFTGPGRP
jgi:competence protein ComEA